MKKLLVILMVVAMASFLFVGCIPSVTPEVEEEEEEEVVAPVSATPVLTDIQSSAAVSIVTVTSTSTQYINKTELGSSILVTGTAPSESRVQIYLDDVAITPAVAEATTSGLWTIAIAKSSLGDDGVKVMTAKVTEVGLDEGEASNAATFTLDTDLPGISSLAATAASALAAPVMTLTSSTTGALVFLTAAAESGTTAPVQTIVTGTWTLSTIADSGVENNVVVTSPSGVATSYSVSDGAVHSNTFIPGVTLTFGSISASDTDITILIAQTTAATATVAARAKVVFDEDLSYSGMTAATYSLNATAGDPAVYNDTAYAGYWTTCAPGAANTTCVLSVYGITDLAGNVGGTLASPLTASCTVGAASATSLAP